MNSKNNFCNYTGSVCNYTVFFVITQFFSNSVFVQNTAQLLFLSTYVYCDDCLFLYARTLQSALTPCRAD